MPNLIYFRTELLHQRSTLHKVQLITVKAAFKPLYANKEEINTIKLVVITSKISFSQLPLMKFCYLFCWFCDHKLN